MLRQSTLVVLASGFVLVGLGCRGAPTDVSFPGPPDGVVHADFTGQGAPQWTKAPHPVFTPAPAQYYAPSLAEAVDGRAVVTVHVGASRGKTLKTRLDESSGNPALDDAALRVLSDFEWEPGYIGDAPVAGWLRIPFELKVNQ